jgi:hypothetical protein
VFVVQVDLGGDPAVAVRGLVVDLAAMGRGLAAGSTAGHIRRAEMAQHRRVRAVGADTSFDQPPVGRVGEQPVQHRPRVADDLAGVLPGEEAVPDDLGHPGLRATGNRLIGGVLPQVTTVPRPGVPFLDAAPAWCAGLVIAAGAVVTKDSGDVPVAVVVVDVGQGGDRDDHLDRGGRGAGQDPGHVRGATHQRLVTVRHLMPLGRGRLRRAG